MAIIQSGVRYCGKYHFGADDNDWNLMGTTGDGRTWAVTVSFPDTFPEAPSVNPFIVSFYILEGESSRISVGVANVTASSFQLQIHTWGDTQVAGVGVGWIAYMSD
jgi:hypothetical protein